MKYPRDWLSESGPSWAHPLEAHDQIQAPLFSIPWEPSRPSGRTSTGGSWRRQFSPGSYDGELRIRRSTTTFEDAFGTLTGTYPAGYLTQLDAGDELR